MQQPPDYLASLPDLRQRQLDSASQVAQRARAANATAPPLSAMQPYPQHHQQQQQHHLNGYPPPPPPPAPFAANGHHPVPPQLLHLNGLPAPPSRPPLPHPHPHPLPHPYQQSPAPPSALPQPTPPFAPPPRSRPSLPATTTAPSSVPGPLAPPPPPPQPPPPSQPSQPSVLLAPTDGGPPFAVPVSSVHARVTALPPGVPFPAIAPADQARVKRWIDRDLAYEQALAHAKARRRQETQDLADDALRRQDWLGPPDGPARARFRIRFDADRAKERDRGKRGSTRRELRLSKADLKRIAKEPEILIPIRLEYEHEAYKLRDTFTWNLRETIVTPEIFASHLCEDLRLPHHPFYKEMVAQIRRHIEDAQIVEEYSAYLGDDLAPIREESRAWFEQRAAKRRRLQQHDEDDDPTEPPLTLRDFKRQDGPDEELRVTIKLDITLDSVQLLDKFEWDLSDPRNSPEDFAEVFAADLGLPGEFRTAIAHSIREQADVYIKSLCLLGHVTGLPIQDDDLRREFLPALFEPFRPDAADFTPLLNQLSPDEVERNDKEREREVRRKRRQTKGRGVTLPDRDPVKTHRTLVPKPSTVPLHSYQDARGDMVYPMPEMNHPYPIVRPAVADKPPVVDDPVAQPLDAAARLAATKGNVVVPTGAATAGGSRLKRLKHGESGTTTPLLDPSSLAAAGGPRDLNGSALSPNPLSLPPHAGATRKKPPVIRLGLDELGLHEHIIGGHWFCANCGVPESCAVGRRKGPSGNNSLCGTCGKYFHRYRKNRPVEYTTDLAHHENIKKEAEAAVAAAAEAAAVARAIDLKESAAAQQRLAASAADAAASAASAPANAAHRFAPSTRQQQQQQQQQPPMATAARRPPPVSRDSSEEPDSPLGGNVSDSSSAATAASRAPSRTPPNRGNSPDLPYVDVASPMSSLSSVSPPPLPAFAPHFANPTPAPPPPAPAAVAPPLAPRSVPVEPLPWMKAAAAELRSKQTDDRFEIIPRPRPPDPALQEWRIRCLDCPGKLYNLGPGETLDNFSVHFKNRQHRANVEARLKGHGSSA